MSKYSKLKLKGLCTCCGGTNDRFPKVLCTDCSEKRAEDKRVKYHSRKENGMCPICEKEWTGGGLCPTCKEQSRNTMRKVRLNRQVDSCCIYCSVEVTTKIKVCDSCKVAIKSYSFERYKRLIKEGLCPRCGSQTNRENKICSMCLEFINNTANTTRKNN